MRAWAQHNAVATFPNMDAAGEALESLSRAGVEGDNISLLGHNAKAAAEAADTRLRDMEVAEDIGRHAATGAAIGGTAGALVGAAAFIIPGIGPVLGAGVWAAAIGGGIAGSSVGGLVGGMSAMDLSDDWELTFQDSLREGKVLVAVHAEDEDEFERAVKALEEHEPEKVERVGPDGPSSDGPSAGDSSTDDSSTHDAEPGG